MRILNKRPKGFIYVNIPSDTIKDFTKQNRLIEINEW